MELRERTTMKGQFDAAIAIIRRIEVSIDAESVVLREQNTEQFAELNKIKAHCLVDLTRLSRVAGGWQSDAEMQRQLSSLKLALDRNKQIVEAHLSAAREVSKILTKLIKSSDYDGTYSMNSILRSSAKR